MKRWPRSHGGKRPAVRVCRAPSHARDLAEEPIKRNLVSAITGFAKESQSIVIAEGVETEGEVDILQELGIELQQGYFFGYPETAQKFER